MTSPKDTSGQPGLGERREYDAITEAVCERLGRDQPVRRKLPGGGRLRIDRQLPFLCVYRAPPEGDDGGTRELVTTQAAYLFASGDVRYDDMLSALCQRISATMQEHYGTFLFVEIWAQEIEQPSKRLDEGATAAFELVAHDPQSLPSTLDVFAQALSEVTVYGRQATVSIRHSDKVSAPSLCQLRYSSDAAGAKGGCVLGLAVRPLYRDPMTGGLYPMVLEQLRRQLARALRKGIAQFTGSESASAHYDSLGPSTLVKAARIVDRELSEVAEAFDFLLQVTPSNRQQAWQEFRESGYQQAPTFFYRPLAYHPSLLKRRLFSINIERIEDPTLAYLFWEKQDELDRQLTALRDLNTRRFVYNSLQLFEGADDELVSLAQAIFDNTAADAGRCGGNGYALAPEVVEQARDEIDYYYRQLSAFDAKVELCDDIAAGTMVSRDRLLISRDIRLCRHRVEPLLHHEIGTHLLTYFNGRCQPFRQLYSGLAGYDELQEGLAVLAEYLCGGLTARRLRTLAGRVLAVRSMTDGASFPATFASLHERFGFRPSRAFALTFRAYRGGGLTKDVIYLRGLRDLLHYLAKGHDIEPLYVGKIGLRHLPYIQELRRRGIINAPSILPRFWHDEQLRARLEGCRGSSILDILETLP